MVIFFCPRLIAFCYAHVKWIYSSFWTCSVSIWFDWRKVIAYSHTPVVLRRLYTTFSLIETAMLLPWKATIDWCYRKKLSPIPLFMDQTICDFTEPTVIMRCKIWWAKLLHLSFSLCQMTWRSSDQIGRWCLHVCKKLVTIFGDRYDDDWYDEKKNKRKKRKKTNKKKERKNEGTKERKKERKKER